ncbi:Putative phage tail fiber protein [Escherichia coli]|nr:Putative phage tail fiber protein [Escherichia coli]
MPIVKGLSIRNGQGYPGAVSFGYLLTEQYGFPVPCIHMRGDGGNDALWQFNPNDKSFISPGALIAGGVRYNTDGNIFGGCWGSNLNDYLNSSLSEMCVWEADVLTHYIAEDFANQVMVM